MPHFARRARRRWRRATIALLAFAGAAGCSHAGRRPPAPPPPPLRTAAETTGAVIGYGTRLESLGSVDASALRGRRIVLDPGHGGVFRGALGVGGLTEAEVNLGVALSLWGILEEAGAEVLLTRTTDRDFLSPADSSLRADLAERVRRAAEFRPEVFLSVHHNADARGLHTLNETQTYYKLADEGPSLDLAQSLHRHLVRNLAITPHRLMPGNYFVLRETECAAALTEASYITHPGVEEKLQIASKQRLEAEALYLGLLDYYSTPAPECVALEVEGAEDSVTRRPRPQLEATMRGAFDTAEILLDGTPLPSERRGAVIYARPAEALASGPHLLEAHARLTGSRAARPVRLRFQVRLPVARLELAAFPGAVEGGGLVALRVTAMDADGRAPADSLRVRVTARNAVPRDTVIGGAGAAWGYFRLRPAGSGKAAPAPGAALFQVTLLEPSAAERLRHGTLEVPRTTGPRRLFGGWLTRAPGDSALLGAELAAPAIAPPLPRGLSPHGFYWTALDDSGGAPLPALRGYRAVEERDDPIPRRWTAWFGGALIGQRVVLDPEGGGEDAGGMGPTGTRAATLNLDLARILATYLQAAGAAVRLTREGDYALSDVERVQTAERFRPHRVIRLGHRSEAPRLGYYFSSAVGRRWADRTVAWLGRLAGAAPPAFEDAQYVLQQTSCPALYVSPASLGTVESEAALLAPGALRREAYALLVALAGDLAGADDPAGGARAWATDSLTLETPDGRPAAWALLDAGGLLLQADSQGRVPLARSEPGDLPLRDGGRGTRLGLLLDSARGERFVLPPSGR